MIRRENEQILIDGTKAEIMSEITQIIGHLIEKEIIGLEELLILFEGVSRYINHKFD